MKKVYECLPRTLEVTTMEELAELQQVISKIFRYGIDDKSYINLLEELADVYLMLELIEDKYRIRKEAIEVNKEFKLERLIKRIKEDREGIL